MGRTINAKAEADQIDAVFTKAVDELAMMDQKQLRILRIVRRNGTAVAAQFEAGFTLQEVLARFEANAGTMARRIREESVAALHQIHESWRVGGYRVELAQKQASAPSSAAAPAPPKADDDGINSPEEASNVAEETDQATADVGINDQTQDAVNEAKQSSSEPTGFHIDQGAELDPADRNAVTAYDVRQSSAAEVLANGHGSPFENEAAMPIESRIKMDG